MNGESNEEMNKKLVYMWGYLPGALPQRSPLLSPLQVKFTPLVDAGSFWTDVCGGGCGFAMAISDTGKLITWGSTDDLGQSYLTSGKHGLILLTSTSSWIDIWYRNLARLAHSIGLETSQAKKITCSCFHGFIDKDLINLVIPDVRRGRLLGIIFDLLRQNTNETRRTKVRLIQHYGKLQDQVRLGLVVVVYRRDDDEKPCINNNDSMAEYSAFVINSS
nr:regulator of chromosome condensation 1/beta-lactamase-inhibitor protein II [Tanacetum cinerariifolium]